MKKLCIIFLFAPLFTLSAMEEESKGYLQKRCKSAKTIDFSLTAQPSERGEADLKKAKWADQRELIDEVYAAKTERGEADLKKAKTIQEPSVWFLLAQGKQHYQDNEPTKAIKFFEEAFYRHSTPLQLYEASSMLGYIYGFKMPRNDAHAKASCDYFSNALQVLNKNPNDIALCDQEKGSIFRFLSFLHLDQGDRTQAKICGQTALEYEERPLMRATVHHVLGLSFRPDDLDTSCSHLQRGIETLLDMVKEKDTNEKKEWVIWADHDKSVVYGNLHKELANTQFLNKLLDDAQANYEKALKFVRSTANKGIIWVQLGLIYHKKAKNCLEKNDHETAATLTELSQTSFKKASQDEMKQCNVIAYNLAKSWLDSNRLR